MISSTVAAVLPVPRCRAPVSQYRRAGQEVVLQQVVAADHDVVEHRSCGRNSARFWKVRPRPSGCPLRWASCR